MDSQAQAARVKEILLEEVPVVARRAISRSMLDRTTVDVDSHARDLAGELIASIRTTVLAEHLASGKATAQKTVFFEMPASPWQMAKRDWRIFRTRLGQRFLARYPVRLAEHSRTVRLEARWQQCRAFPEAELSIPPPNLGRPVRLEMLSQEAWVE